MLKGLRKRETYDELINELEEDPIKKYPDRRASQIENSNLMSQLALGFQEVIEQNNRIMKEKTKALLLQEASASGGLSHSMSVAQSRYDSPLASLTSHGLRNYPRPDSLPPQFRIDTPPMSEKTAYSMSSAAREWRHNAFGDDVDREAFFQTQERWKESLEEAQRQAERTRQVVSEVRQQHLGNITTIDTLVPEQPDVEMAAPEDILEANPFEGIFSGVDRASSSSQMPVQTMVEKIEQKEKKEQKKEPKPKGRPKKFSKPNDEPDDQPEQTQGRASSRPKRNANTPPSGRPEPKRKPNKSDDEVELTGVTLNKNTSINYWAQQSPKELRAQLKLRNVPINDYAFLKKPQLVEFIRNLIRTYNW